MNETYLHRLSRPYRVATGDTRPAGAGSDYAVVSSVPGRSRDRAPDRRRRVDAPDRRRRVDACAVCGRTLLAGERAREIVWGERVIAACPLCVADWQRRARPRAA